ncbi:MAG: GTPase ObgE [Lachnospiraceae bacterium]|nr:GTPase ObgE [Lachnospiraceae bacterium]MBQ4309609.1 GTPase ObgE [Lachnospiraceae bacterium]
MFADYAKITIRSGKGGDGHVSFRRELYVPNGGPDGGDGGKGGDIIFEVDRGMNTLADFKHKRKYAAEDGEEGGKRKCHGANGADRVIRVPEGTVVKDAESGLVIADMSAENQRAVILRGGRGGKGNMHYATAVMQAPKYAQPGKPGKEIEVILELKVIADVGLVGFPNAGKSTFLSRVTNARPKIASYPFTTLDPHLGVVDLGDGANFVIADIPGLIEGASEGVGLGHRFLRHIERTKVLLHLVDAAAFDGRDPVDDIDKINAELAAFSEDLAGKPQIIAANKVDAVYVSEGEKHPLDRIREIWEPRGVQVFGISAVTGEGVKELISAIHAMLSEMDDAPTVFEQEYDPMEAVEEAELPFTVEKVAEGMFSVQGPRVERMLGYTNLDSEKGFAFFQNFIKENGIEDTLKELGIADGDTVDVCGWEFEYLS